MKRLLAVMVFLSAAAFAQNSRYDNIASGARGPIPFATVAVCTQPANTTSAPCTPVANLCSSFTDVICNQPNPFQADLLGNFHFYAPSALAPYTIQIYGPQVATPYVMQDQLLAVGGQAPAPVNTLPNCTAAGTVQNEGLQFSTQVVNSVTQLCGTLASASSNNVVAICVSSCGNSGSANVVYNGYANGIFDGTTIQGDYAIPSATPGQFTDIGSVKPSGTVEVFGVIASTNTGAGTASSILVSPLSLFAAGSSLNSGNINNAAQFKLPYYSASGSSNVLSGDICTTDGSGNETCHTLATNGVGTGTVTFANGSAPSNPASGNSLLYTDNTNGFLHCLTSSGANCLGSTGGTASAMYTFFPSSSTSCSTYSRSGTTYCAQNNLTGTIDFSGTDAAAVFNSVLNANGTVGGLLLIKNGVYNINSLTLETATNCSNFIGTGLGLAYGIGIPANTPYINDVQWFFIGESTQVWQGESISSSTANTGVIFNVTSTAISSVPANSIAGGIMQRVNNLTGGCDLTFTNGGNDLKFENITVTFPNNQRGNEIAIASWWGETVEYDNVIANFAQTSSSISTGPAPVPGTYGLIGLTSTTSGAGAVQRFENTGVFGYDLAYDFQSEMITGTNITATFNNRACEFGRSATSVFRASNIGRFEDNGNAHGCLFGPQMTLGSQVNFGSYDIGYVFSTGNFSTRSVPDLSESTPGNSGGIINFSVTRQTTGVENANPALLFSSGGQNFSKVSSFGGLNSPNLTTLGTDFNGTVQTGPQAPANTISDNFPGSTLGVNWAITSGSFAVSSGVVTGNTALTENVAYYASVPWSTAQSSQITIQACGTHVGGPAVRVSSAGGYAAFASCTGIDLEYCTKPDCTTGGVITGAVAETVVSGDVIVLSVNGTTLTVTYNGTQIISATDSHIAIGSPGIMLGNNATNTTVKLWQGSNIGVNYYQTTTTSTCETAGAPTTVNTGSATTTTGLSCLPANAVIDAVLYRITTTITTAANFTVGITGTTSKFCSTQSTLTVGTTGICAAQTGTTGALDGAAAAAVVVTFNATPGAGAIRLVVVYHTWTPPTS